MKNFIIFFFFTKTKYFNFQLTLPFAKLVMFRASNGLIFLTDTNNFFIVT